jgi:hypothetical protein
MSNALYYYDYIDTYHHRLQHYKIVQDLQKGQCNLQYIL